MGCTDSKAAVVTVASRKSKPKEPQDKDSTNHRDNVEEQIEDTPEVEQAAIKIQSLYRGYRVRKDLENQDDASTDPGRPLTGNNHDRSINWLSDDQDMANAATKIQASFRGHMARKQVEKARQETDPVPKEESAKEENKNLAEEELDVDLSDPELAVAATKIQASFRGHMTRKNAPKN